MLEIAPEKVAHVIVRAREIDAKVDVWDQPGDEDGVDSILENRANDATGQEVSEFIASLNIDEQVSLVALTWIGRGTYGPEELEEAKATALSERINPTENYLLGIPLLADYLEEGLDRLGISVEGAEAGIL